MTEPTPDPDEPGEGLRTRLAPGSSGSQVNGALSNGKVHGTGTLDTVAGDRSMPTNGTTDGTTHLGTTSDGDGTASNGNGGTSNGNRTPGGRPYADGTNSDTIHVDAASHGTAPGNDAPGGETLAGAAARATVSANGAYVDNAHVHKARTNGARTDGARANGARHRGESGDGARAGGNGVRVSGGMAGNGTPAPGNGTPATRNGTLAPANGASAAGNGASAAGNGHYLPRSSAGLPGVAYEPGGGESVTFGFGETAGVLPGDQRTFDDVEAGIVALWRQFGEQREQPLRDRLVLHYAPLVKYVAGRVGTGLPAHVEVADLIQSGIFGLVDAIEKFEPERGLKFETYAMQRIRGAILDDLRAQDWVPRSVRGRAREVERALERLGAQLRRTPTDAELAEELGLSLHELRDVYAQLQLTSVVALDELAAAGRGPTPLADILEDQEALDPVALLVDQDNRRQLAQAIAHLAERDRVVVTLYYFENLTLAEIGRVLGVTESRVCQLHTRAVLRLRAKLLEKSDA